MIQANELRIGNKVMVGDFLVEVDLDLFCSIKGGIKTSDIEGIYLTPEILKKCGFTYRSHLKDHYKVVADDNAILIIKDWCTAICGSNQQQIVLDNKTLYLHQLQNLYFALTGKELEVKL